MASRRQLLLACAWAWLTCGVACADPVWVTEPARPGPDAPPLGRSLFDHLTGHDGRQVVPFPIEALLASLERRLAAEGAYLDRPLKKVLIPLGRSLQRDAAAPAFFESPRVVVAVDTEPRGGPGGSGMLLRDRLFIAYLEAADVLEVISYNEDAARFEFQVVTDYRRGGGTQVRIGGLRDNGDAKVERLKLLSCQVYRGKCDDGADAVSDTPFAFNRQAGGHQRIHIAIDRALRYVQCGRHIFGAVSLAIVQKADDLVEAIRAGHGTCDAV